MASRIQTWRRKIGLAIAGESTESSVESVEQYFGDAYVYCTRTAACPYGKGHDGPCSVC